jgi:hypothetical protein
LNSDVLEEKLSLKLVEKNKLVKVQDLKLLLPVNTLDLLLVLMPKVIAKAIMINVQTHVHNMVIVLTVFVNALQDGSELIVILKLDVLTIVQIKEHVMLMDLVLANLDILEMIVKYLLLFKTINHVLVIVMITVLVMVLLVNANALRDSLELHVKTNYVPLNVKMVVLVINLQELVLAFQVIQEVYVNLPQKKNVQNHVEIMDLVIPVLELVNVIRITMEQHVN